LKLRKGFPNVKTSEKLFWHLSFLELNFFSWLFISQRLFHFLFDSQRTLHLPTVIITI
jgi:hypothetical protein